MNIITIHRKGLKQRAIARKLCISSNTIKKYIENPNLTFEPLHAILLSGRGKGGDRASHG